MSTSMVATKELVPLLGMMWRGMWGATATTAAAAVLAEDESDEDPEDETV